MKNIGANITTLSFMVIKKIRDKTDFDIYYIVYFGLIHLISFIINNALISTGLFLLIVSYSMSASCFVFTIYTVAQGFVIFNIVSKRLLTVLLLV